MTKTQALKEAKKRWGKHAAVKDSGKARQSEDGKHTFWRFDVGRIALPDFFPMFEVMGSGATWEDAFTEADRRAESRK